MAKSRSWTFPVYPSAGDGIARVSVAGCQPLFPASRDLIFLCTAAEEAASLREEDSDAGGEDIVPKEEVGVVVLEAQYSVSEVHCSVSQVQYTAR